LIPLQKVAFQLAGDFSLQAEVPKLAGSISLQSPENEMLLRSPGCMGEQQMPTKLKLHLRPARILQKLQCT